MKYLLIITGNKILISALIGWLIAQIIKVGIGLIKEKRFNWHRLFGAGGMPSSHSSSVVAMTVKTARIEGLDSSLFAVAAALSIIVMYDAAGVRRAAGEQAKILNYMIEHWHEYTPEMRQKELKELIGHTPIEVLVGAILDLIIGFLL